MHRKISQKCLILLSFCIIGYIVFMLNSRMKGQAMTLKYNQELAKKLNMFDPSLFANGTDFECKSAKINHLSFPMCLYTNEEDRWISGLFRRGEYFEKELVVKFIELFDKYTDVTFLDLGTNIGTYSLPIAHLGRHVVSVEPSPDTYRRLAKSIHLGGIAKEIDALNCAIADDRYTSIKFDPTIYAGALNLGTFSGTCEPKCIFITATTLNSLLPLMRNKKVIMKVDVEGSEIKIFTRKSAAKFFEASDVPIIMMEWVLYPLRYGDTEAKRRMVDRFIEFFYQRGYEVYDPRTEKKLSSDWTMWSTDILLKKEDLKSNKLFSLGD